MVECYFSNIENHILDYLKQCDSALVCSAWCSNPFIIDALSFIDSSLIVTHQTKYIRGCYDYNHAEFTTIKNSVLQFYMGKPAILIHNKYIVLIRDKVPYAIITGSYNFTSQAQNNFENIVYIEDHKVAKQYYDNFHELTKYCTIL